MRFEYEWRDDSGQWYRSYGNENWEFDELGYMKFRFANINDLPIRESERKFCWERKIRRTTVMGKNIEAGQIQYL